MFTILARVVYSEQYGRDSFDRYYHKWGNAKKVMEDEVKQCLENGFTLTKSLDRMNIEKGFYEYEKELQKTYDDGVAKIVYALISGYFCD